MTKRPRISVVMGTHNGAPYLREQIDTILAQTTGVDCLLISDDGSSDRTLNIIQEYGKPVRLLGGPRRGYERNYLSLVRKVPDDTDYLALADQDDHWMPEKLERAVELLQKSDNARPCLYGSRSWVCDADLRKLRVSRGIDPAAIGFRHALTQNFAGGNTFVMNRAALMLARSAHPENGPIHDWWLYLLISGAGGRIVFDDRPGLYYRQHGGNQIGANFRALSHLKRIRDMISGRYRAWNSENLEALYAARQHLTPEARALLDRVREGRDGSLLRRLTLANRSGLYRQGWLGQAGLVASLILRKF